MSARKKRKTFPSPTELELLRILSQGAQGLSELAKIRKQLRATVWHNLRNLHACGYVQRLTIFTKSKKSLAWEVTPTGLSLFRLGEELGIGTRLP